MYREAFQAWTRHLRDNVRYGPGNALFPKIEMGVQSGRMVAKGLSCEPYSCPHALAKVVKEVFRAAGLPSYPALTPTAITQSPSATPSARALARRAR